MSGMGRKHPSEALLAPDSHTVPMAEGQLLEAHMGLCSEEGRAAAMGSPITASTHADQ